MILDERRIPKGFPTSFAKIARRNRFEALKGSFAGRYSRINNQWRIVFRWTSVGPEEVEIRDYH
jgi:plasmid maintenance system killer protein